MADAPVMAPRVATCARCAKEQPFYGYQGGLPAGWGTEDRESLCPRCWAHGGPSDLERARRRRQAVAETPATALRSYEYEDGSIGVREAYGDEEAAVVVLLSFDGIEGGLDMSPQDALRLGMALVGAARLAIYGPEDDDGEGEEE